MIQFIASKITGVAKRHKENGHHNAYLAVPVFISFAVMYILIQVWVYFIPEFHFSAYSYHIHHYTYGIVLVLICGYIGLWAQSEKSKIACAIGYGIGAALILDEAFMWFALNPANGYQDYDLIVVVAALLLGFIVAPYVLYREKKDTHT